ncbi:hypothetical protein Desor_0365 [Desulfosporosinus orientis DSM 765]|uniref:Pyruvate formate lyase-activating protein n=1 Tax=Desulfosporosinus orientis (strain ATCC 19365 / DSM 765 / NCIMB 8382 / VKM B-1628 / Singapore I) TaxID=768706 RepID=G7W556_DESOD|nr:DUF1786 domain-containing protein [Desulfosporosinus orientis]AET66072.1 hypothetical protein Desor_0365 [Desulfosporosinus orientis DSM 765]
MQESILVVDVGSGTQDMLLYQPGKNLENCPKFIVPSQTQIAAAKIRKATAQRKHVFLHGFLMGGGANGAAIKAHLASGLNAYATPQAALTFNDNLAVVEEMGIILCDKAPDPAVPIWLGDIDRPALKQAFAAFGLEYPVKTAVAVQDHGYSIKESNRTLRFQLWKDFVMQGGNLKKLVFKEDIPEVFTRMRSVREIVPGAILTDTGTAALLGIMADDYVKPHLNQGILAVNVGNSHTLVAAIRGERVFGIFEQHTSMLNTESLSQLIRRFQAAELTNAEIYEQGGHGSALHPEMSPGWNYIAVTGPRRSMVKSLNWYEAAPYGDMMLTGSFGILAGLEIT